MQDIHQQLMGGGGGGGGGVGGGAGGAFFGGGDRRMRVPHHHNHQYYHQQQQALKCPRCDSLNTKFCYYNNYNLSQPRHFCKSCRRYWTKGGVLRNVPVGGGCRKAKRSKSKQSSSAEKSSIAADDGEGKPAASHSSSESSSAAATTAIALEDASVPVSGFPSVSFNNPKLYENGIELSALLGQGSSAGGIFAEFGSYTSLVATSSNETTPLGFGGKSVNQQCLDQDLKVEGDKKRSGALLDNQTMQIEFPARSLDHNVGFGPLDWGGGPGGDQALFDITSTVDHAYWSQSQWTTDQDHGGLYLP